LDECYDALVTTQFGEGLEETAIGEAPSPAILLLLRRLVRPWMDDNRSGRGMEARTTR